MAGKEEKKFIIIERDRDENGPFIVEDSKGPIYFNDYDKAKSFCEMHVIDPYIVNMY